VSGSSETADTVRYGVYGTKGTPDPDNVPGVRSGSVSWTDARGDLWLFGGLGYAASGYGSLNDLWRWSISNGQWTWVSGANEVNHTGTYGAKGVEAPENVPGARSSSVSWTDTNGNLWLFGGLGWSASVFGALNDLWQWNVPSGEWTWVSGSSSVNQSGTYGTQGVAVPESAPGARYGSVAWADAKGNLWLFGGLGSDANRGGYQNDLWVWDISRGQWTWVGGSNLWNQGNSYGTDGGPGARLGALSWIDTAGNLWLFGRVRNEKIPQ
jgi:hypothetical protein